MTKIKENLNTHTTESLAVWRLIGIILLAVRFTQGWIYWGGGSRRFIYSPSKLDPHATNWLANKFQAAMPGALLGLDKVVDYMLHHFVLLYTSAILFSLAELIFGLFLLLGFMTRLSALVTIGMSFVLMMLFGWQGATCIDEWTMASANFAMGVTLFVGGAAAFSVDSWLMRHKPTLTTKPWFQYLGSGPWSNNRVNRWGVVGVIVTILFVVLTYNDFRGSVITPFHGGPVSPAKHHISLSEGHLQADGTVRFTAYVDAGTPAEPSNIIAAKLIGPDGATVEEWSSARLAALPKSIFANEYDYNKFKPGFAGISAEVGARATISLPPSQPGLALGSGMYALVLHSVNGESFMLQIRRAE